MLRVLLAAAVGLLLTNSLSADCRGWTPIPYPPTGFVPAYPLTPAIWGAPAPKPLPPLPPPFVPKPGVGVKEEDTAPPKPGEKPKEGDKPKEGNGKDKDGPKIPKVKIPPLPGEPFDVDPPTPKKESPKSDAPKKEPGEANDKAVEQFYIPTDGKRAEPRAEVKVGFFNHSDREIVLDVNGESLKLPSEQYVTLRLPRTFKWSEKGKSPAEVTIPADADGVEIVFRK
jgi:hypothetical protein